MFTGDVTLSATTALGLISLQNGNSLQVVGNNHVLSGGGVIRAFLIAGIAADGQSAAPTTVAISDLTITNVLARGGNGTGGRGLGGGRRCSSDRRL